MLADMLELAHAGRIEKWSCRLVLRKRVLRPAVPQAFADVDEFTRPFVAQFMRGVLRLAEIERVARIRGRDDVPAGAPFTDVIERAEFARQEIRLLIGGRRGRQETDVL